MYLYMRVTMCIFNLFLCCVCCVVICYVCDTTVFLSLMYVELSMASYKKSHNLFLTENDFIVVIDGYIRPFCIMSQNLRQIESSEAC